MHKLENKAKARQQVGNKAMKAKLTNMVRKREETKKINNRNSKLNRIK